MLDNREYLIFSVDRSDASESNNSKARRDAIETMLALGIEYRPLIGCYQGQLERSFVVSRDTLDTVVMLTKRYNQDSYIHLLADNTAILLTRNGESIRLGKFSEVSESEALASEAYTLVPDTRKYFVAKTQDERL